MMELFAAVISGGASGGGGAITANWANISESSPTGATATTSSTVVYTGGGSRDLLLEHDVTLGYLSYKIDSGSYYEVTTGMEITVTTDQTVTFKYTCFFVSESATLTVTDTSGPTLVDTITLDFTFTG